MNLSPEWIPVLEQDGHQVLHWASIGSPDAADTEIMEWARNAGFTVLTHDLDFSALLAASGERAPSVVQIRAQDVRPHQMGPAVRKVIVDHAVALTSGALVTIDPRRSRVRVLPLP